MSFKMDHTDPNAIDYAEILSRVTDLLEQITATYNDNEFGRAIKLAEDIGKLYAPSDSAAANRVAYLVQLTAGRLYFGGTTYQIEKQAERVRKLSPPF